MTTSDPIRDNAQVSGRALTVVQLVPALESGGAERSALEIAHALVMAGHRSIVVSAGGRMVEQLEAEGSEHVQLDIGHKSLATLAKILPLRRLIIECKADIVHARSRLPAWLGLIAARGLKTHFVTTMHGLNSPGRYSSVMVRGERVILVSHAVRDFVLSHYPWVDQSRLVVIPRGVDPEAFPYGYAPEPEWLTQFAHDYPQLGGAPLLTLPGRGTRLKGHADAIALHADLKERGVPTRLLLLGIVEAGREKYVEEMRQLAANRGVTDTVVFSPQRKDMRDVLAHSALVLQLSNYPESFGRTVVEALALCRPVLGYAHGGVGALLSELYPAGRVQPGNPERLVERAAELLRRAPAIQPLKDYTLETMQSAVLEVYQQLATP